MIQGAFGLCIFIDMKWLFFIGVVLVGLVLVGQKIFEDRDVRVLRVRMHLGAGGVESDKVPNADAMIDFEKDTGYCRKWYTNPAYRDTSYELSRHALARLFEVMEKPNWADFKRDFRRKATDQPESTTVIYTTTDSISIKDYGLIGDAPLQELYKAVYQLR